MGLLPAQMTAMGDARLRDRYPQYVEQFKTADRLIADIGLTCPRLASFWDMLTRDVGRDAGLWDFLDQTFPGMPMNRNGTSPQRPGKLVAAINKPVATSTLPPSTDRPLQPAGPVARAIDVLNSYRKS